MKIDARGKWEEIVSAAPEAGTETISVGQFRLHFGVDTVDGHPLPVLFLPGLKREPIKTFGFQVTSVKGRLGKDDPESSFLRVTCLAAELIPVFLRFVDEVFELLDAGTPPATALEGALGAWRQFLEGPGGPTLDRGEMLGLWGEVIFLRSLLVQGGNPLETLNAWKGPSKADWDFELHESVSSSIRVEVKTTTGQERRISINNPKQLLCEIGFGWLCLYRVNEVGGSGGGLSLPEAIRQVLDGHWGQGISGSAFRSRFWKLLSQAGYSPAQEGHYTDRSFRTTEELWFRVGPEFPVLRLEQIPADTRSRISELRYTFSLAGLSPEPRPSFHV